MTGPDLLGHLRLLAPEPRLAAVRAALPLAAGAEREALHRRLAEVAAESERAAPAALAELAARWPELGAASRADLIALARGRWERLAQELGDDPERRAVIADLAEAVREPALVRALPGLLCADERAAGRAERALVRLASEAFADPGMGESLSIAEAIARSARTFEAHRRRGPVVAAVLLLRSPGTCPPALRALVADTEHPAARALRGALRYTNMPAVRAQAWRWMPVDALGAAAMDRLVRAGTDAEHEAVLRMAHLALNPRRARRLRLVEAGGRVVRTELRGKAVRTAAPIQNGPLPDPERLWALSPAARRGLPRFARALVGPEGVKRAVTDPLLGDPDPGVRMAALSCARADELADFCFDPAAPVARTAALRWSVCGAGLRGAHAAGAERRARLNEALTRSPHPGVRAIAVSDAARLELRDGRRPASRVAAWRALADDRAAQVERLRAAVSGGEPAARVGAVLMVRTLRLVDELEPELVGALGCGELGEPLPEARVAATAAATLGEARGAASWAALNQALRSTDARVRANAAEAMGRRDLAASRERLVELRGDDGHRARGAAVRALLRDEAAAARAAESLASMMGDDRPAHRLAAAWLAERTLSGRGVARLGIAWPELARRLEVLAVDADPAVRARAARAVGRVTRQRRAAWSRGLEEGAALS